MADRTIRTVLELNATRFTAGVAQASASAKSLAGEMDRLGGKGSAFRESYDRAGTTLLGFGAAVTGGLGLASKAAMGWESAWTGVTKTVNGSAAEMAVLEGQLRGLATTLPASHEQIAAVAEAAGQLGIQRENVTAFTKTMIDLGETTNLTADEAATSLARFSNIMGTTQGDVDRLGSTLVGLGNSYATTEQEIMQMGLRLAGTGRQIGMTEGDVLGLSAAMSSVGIEAEAGGTAMSTVMKKIDKAVDEGGDSITKFASLAGMSAQDFATAWNEHPSQALTAVVTGLQKVSTEGGNVSSVLDDLGVKGIREQDALLRLTGAADLLGEAMAQGNTEFERNSALIAEATKRYETSESRMRIAGNQMKDVAIDVGGAILPALVDAAEGAAGLAEAFGKLPAPVQSAVGYLGATIGVSALVAGGLMKVVPAASETIAAFQRLRTESPQLASSLGKVGKAAGIAGAALGLLAIGGGVLESFTTAGSSADQLAVSLANLTRTNRLTASSFDELAVATLPTGAGGVSGIESFGQMLSKIDEYGGPVTNTLAELSSGFGLLGNTVRDDLLDGVESVDQALAGLANSGAGDQLAQSFRAAIDSAAEYGQSAGQVLDQMPKLKAALTEQATAMGLAADNQTLVDIALGRITTSTGTAADSAGQLTDATDDAAAAAEAHKDALHEEAEAVRDVGDAFLGVRGSAREYQQAIDDATKSAEEHGRTLDIDTEAGRQNQAALDDIAQSALDYSAAQYELNGSAEEANGILADARQRYIDAAEAMGMPAEQAEALADQLGLVADAYQGLPDDVSTTLSADSTPAKEAIDDTNSDLKAYDSTTVIASLDADTTAGKQALTDLETAIDGSETSVSVNARCVDAEDALGILMEEIEGSNGMVTIDGETVRAEDALGFLMDEIDSGVGTITIEGNTGPADQATAATVGRANSSTGNIKVDADTAAAEQGINTAARNRTSTITVKYSMAMQSGYNQMAGVSSGPGPWKGRADGGFLAPSHVGLAGGGWVPGTYPGPGVDNVLWPVRSGLASGGRFLDQPLAGGEYVVPTQQARQWAPMLEYIREGGKPTPQATVERGPLIGSLNVAPIEGASPREQGQYIAGYLGAHLSI